MSQCEESSASQADSNSELEVDEVRECRRGTGLHAVYVKKKKKDLLLSAVSLASAGPSLAVCLFPWQLGAGLLDRPAGVRRCKNPSRISQIVWRQMPQAASDS